MCRRIPENVKEDIVKCSKERKSTVQIAREIKTRWGLQISRTTVSNLVKKSEETGSVKRRPNKKPDPRTLIKDIHSAFLNFCLESDPETTLGVLRRKLKETFDVDISKSHMSRLRQELGWKRVTNVGYCQMISKKNQDVRLDWCIGKLQEKDTFDNVIFTDETTVELNQCGRVRFYREQLTFDHTPKKAPKPKHAYKVHVWGGISQRGRTSCCVFTGIMDSLTYQQILADNLLPFVQRKFPDGFRLYQDNDSKHKSRSTMKWFEDAGVLDSIMSVPASSPDLNPIENVWADMKRHLRDNIKPRTKDQLVDGIFDYWKSLTVSKCCSFVGHIHKVIPHVILNNGGPTVY